MTKELLTPARRERMKEWATVAIVTFVGGAVYVWQAGIGFVEYIRATGQFLIWAALFALFIRILYFPVQYLRHRAALRREINRERRKTEGATAEERVSAHIVSGNHR